MNNNKETLVGNIISINGNRISVKMTENLKSTMPIIDGLVYRVGQIGSFLRIPLGYANLYGIVTQIGADAIPESLKEIAFQEDERNLCTRWMSLVLMGERVGNKFERCYTISNRRR